MILSGGGGERLSVLVIGYFINIWSIGERESESTKVRGSFIRHILNYTGYNQ